MTRCRKRPLWLIIPMQNSKHRVSPDQIELAISSIHTEASSVHTLADFMIHPHPVSVTHHSFPSFLHHIPDPPPPPYIHYSFHLPHPPTIRDILTSLLRPPQPPLSSTACFRSSSSSPLNALSTPPLFFSSSLRPTSSPRSRRNSWACTSLASEPSFDFGSEGVCGVDR